MDSVQNTYISEYHVDGKTLVQRSGDEVSAGDSACNRSEAYEDST